MPSLIGDAWDWLNCNAGAIQSVGVFLTLLTVFFAARQLGEASAQRDVADSFALIREFDQLLSAWSKASIDDKGDALAKVLVAYEVAAAGINHHRFAKITRNLVRHHICDGIYLVCKTDNSTVYVRSLMTGQEVCRELRLFLLEHYSIMKLKSAHSKIYAAFFHRCSAMSLWQDDAGGVFARTVYCGLMRLHVEPSKASQASSSDLPLA